MNFIIQLQEVDIFINVLKVYVISGFAYYLSTKIVNHLNNNRYRGFITYIIIFVISILCGSIRWMSNYLFSIICLISLLSIVFAINNKSNIGYSLCVTVISLSISYILFFMTICLSFIPNVIFHINNNYLNFLVLILIYSVLICLFLRIKKFKQGFAFLQRNLKNDYFEVIILNMGIIILFFVIILSNYRVEITGNIGVAIILFSIIMFITIQKSLQLYYKQKMLIQDLKETKEELEKKKIEIQELEKENLNFSKISHSIAHKQKSLEYKINQLILKNEMASEMDLRERLEKITKELQKETKVELAKTDIPEIDDMLSYMQSECIKNGIDFQMQLSGNVHYIENHYISAEKLEILLADHIKNAIIAIRHSNNTNKSILVRLGEIDGIYSLYIYDSGIEFTKETLDNLSKKPITTHADEGGTGMGFMNTFDTLRECQASLIIQEYGKPCPDNFTKVLQIKFDKKNEFKIYSYQSK